MRHKKIAEILSGLTRQLSRHVINATNEHTITTEALHIRVILGIVQTERMIDSSAVLHELDRTARIGRDIADGEQSMRQRRTTWRRGQPRLRGRF